MVRSGKKVGLLDHMGGGNLGDDATFDAVMQNIQKRWPDSEIFAFSMNPSDTHRRHGVHSYPLRSQTWDFGHQPADGSATLTQSVKAALGNHLFLYVPLKTLNAIFLRFPRAVIRELSFLTRSFRILRTFDLLIISGGGQLLDCWGGPWKFPYTVFKWVLLAKLAHVRCIVVNVGAGPLTRPLSKWFVRRALFLAEYVSFRDEKSCALVHNIGFSGRAHVFPDSVYGLDFPLVTPRLRAAQGASVVGIAPMAYGDQLVYPEHDPAIHKSFIRGLVLFGSRLLSEQYRLSLFCSDIGIDPPVVANLDARLRADCRFANNESVLVPSLHSDTDLLSAMASMDYVVTSRFHGVIFAHMLNIPVIAISHHPKVRTLMHALGLTEYCLDIHSCDADRLTETFFSLVKHRAHVKSRMRETLARYQRELSSQFDGLFPEEACRSVLAVPASVARLS